MRADERDRARHARLVIRKRLDTTVPHPELMPADFVAAWLDGDVRLDELAQRMGVPPELVERMRKAALDAALASLDN